MAKNSLKIWKKNCCSTSEVLNSSPLAHLNGIWFSGERERNISGAFALAMSDWAERTHTERNIELSVTPLRFAHMLWFRWCQACVVATRWGVQRQVCLAYSQAWWWECHGLGLHECCWHWGATVHWGNHECQHVLWQTEAEHDPLPLETGPQGSITTL